MVRFYYLLFLSGILLAFPDIQAKTKSADTSLLNWDVAPETKMVIMSIETGNRAQLFYANDGDTVAYLISRDTNFNIYQPRFVFDSVIIAIKASTENEITTNHVVKINLRNGRTDSLFSHPGIITEVVPNLANNEILFCSATEYRAYSPIGVPAAHGFDIYSFDLNTKAITRITKLNSYNLGELEPVTDRSIFFHKYEGAQSGIFNIWRKDGKLTRVVPREITRDIDMLSMPVIDFAAGSLFFLAPYEMYKMSLSTQQAQLVVDGKGTSHFGVVRLHRASRTIFFSKQRKGLVIYQCGYDGNNIKGRRFRLSS